MSTTLCPCPHPPGGSVTCEGTQFAYCHIVDGEVRSGCIPIPKKINTPPTKATIVPLFKYVLVSAGFEDWVGLDGVYYATTNQPQPWRFRATSDDLPETLEFAMKNGLSIGLISANHDSPRDLRSPYMLLIRFPGNWTQHDASPQGSLATAG